jgi:hypothetical protein
MIGISFGGMEYRGTDSVPCFFCAPTKDWLRHAWVVHDNDLGRKYYLCENHYKSWENKRYAALLKVGLAFRSAVHQEGQK